MTEKEFDPIAASRTEFPMFFQMQPVLKVQAQKVLFDEKLTREVMPKVDVVHIWCARAQWYCAYGMVETERQYKEHVKEGHEVRPMRFIEIPSGNHFVSRVLCRRHMHPHYYHTQVHWDDPEDFWVATVDAIQN
jgi:hypothetical protein